jgi:hypothetical protein
LAALAALAGRQGLFSLRLVVGVGKPACIVGYAMLCKT